MEQLGDFLLGRAPGWRLMVPAPQQHRDADKQDHCPTSEGGQISNQCSQLDLLEIDVAPVRWARVDA